MKVLFSILAITSFLVIAVFGLPVITYHNTHSSCVISVLGNLNCANTYSGFNLMATLFSFLVISLFFIKMTGREEETLRYSSWRTRMLSWISLHENSPALN